jgi:hypothetical protein
MATGSNVIRGGSCVDRCMAGWLPVRLHLAHFDTDADWSCFLVADGSGPGPRFNVDEVIEGGGPGSVLRRLVFRMRTDMVQKLRK